MEHAATLPEVPDAAIAAIASEEGEVTRAGVPAGVAQ